MDQIRIHHLIKDDRMFKAFLLKPPRLKYPHNNSKPWRLFVQKTRGGPWAKKEYAEYTQAFHALRKYLPVCHDAAINCLPEAFPPPQVKQNYKVRVKQKNGKFKVEKRSRLLYIPMPMGHEWCGLCRRPTVFKASSTHPLSWIELPDNPVRCSLCGVREVFLRSLLPEYPFSTTLEWPLP